MSDPIFCKGNDNPVWQRIAEALKLSRVRQGAMGNLIGLDQPSMSELVRGQRTEIEFWQLKKIAERTGFTADQLRGRKSLFNLSINEPEDEPPSNERALDALLMSQYPKRYDDDFKAAHSIALTGTNMRRIISDHKLKYVISLLRKKGTIKVLMHHPEFLGICEVAKIQDQGPDFPIQKYLELVDENLSAFCWLRTKYPDQVMIRVMRYMPAFGLDLFHGETPGTGIIWVRVYPLPDRSQTGNFDRPILRLRHVDGDWHTFFKKQFILHWNEIGEDLPTYSWENGVERLKSDLSRELINAIENPNEALNLE